MKENKRLIKNTGIIAIGNLSTKVVSFFLLPLYTAILSTQDYGTYDYIVSISGFAVPFFTMLMDESVFRFLIDCKDDNERKEVITIEIVVVLAGTILFMAISGIFFQFYSYTYALYLLIYIASSICCNIINPVLRGLGKIKAYALYNFLMSSTTIFLNILFIAVLHLGVIGMIWAAVLSHFLVSIIFAIYVKLWRYIRPNRISMIRIKEMIRFSIPLVPNKVSWSIINLSDRIMLTNIVGSSASGLYAVSYKFPNLMDMVYGFFYQAWKESSARVVEDEGRNSFYNNIYEYLKRFLFSLVLVMIAFMPLVYKIMINEAYYESLFYVPILLLATYFSNMSGFYGGIFTAYKDTQIMGTTTVVAAIINITINFIAISRFEIWAAAMSTLLANVVVYVYRKRKLKQYVKLDENIIESMIATIMLLVILTLFYRNTVMSCIIGCFFSIIYAIICNINIFKLVVRNLRHERAV